MFYNFSKQVLSLIFYPFYRLEVEGLGKIPKDGKLIICLNHRNNLDAVFAALSTERDLYFMGKSELFEKKFFSTLITSLHAFPIERGKSDIDAIRRTIKIVEEEKVLCIFPEGTRIKGEPKRENMKDGVGLIALKAGADILPIMVDSSYKPFKKTRVYVRDLINIEDFEGLKTKKAIPLVMDEVYYRLYDIER